MKKVYALFSYRGREGSQYINTSISSFQEWEKNFGYGQLKAFGSRGNSWKVSVALNTTSSFRYWVKKTKKISLLEYKNIVENIWCYARAEVALSNYNNYVSSCEYIYNLCGEEERAVRLLRDNFIEIFGDVRIIIYLREQVSFLKSLYAQSITGSSRSNLTYSEFIDSLDDYRIFWDYASGLQLWSRVFGKDKLRVVVFDDKNFLNRELISDFLHNIDYKVETYFASEYRKNVSATYFKLQLLRNLNSLPIDSKGYVYSLLRDTILNSRMSAIVKREFPSKFDEIIIDKVSPGNKWVNNEFAQNSSVELCEKCTF